MDLGAPQRKRPHPIQTALEPAEKASKTEPVASSVDEPHEHEGWLENTEYEESAQATNQALTNEASDTEDSNSSSEASDESDSILESDKTLTAAWKQCQRVSPFDVHERKHFLRFKVKSALTNEDKFPSLIIHRAATIADIVRLLCNTAYTQSHQACRVQLMLGNRLLDNSNELRSIDNSIEISEESYVVFHAVTRPVLLTWEELRQKISIPATEIRTLAETKAKELVKHCREANRWEVNVADDEWDWRSLLRNTTETYHRHVIGPGVVELVFRMTPHPRLRPWHHGWEEGKFAIWELTCADGDRWRLHLHDNGSFIHHIPFKQTIAAWTSRLHDDGSFMHQIPFEQTIAAWTAPS